MIGLGLAVGHKGIGMEFDINSPYTFCRICGALYQGPDRKEWSQKHSNTHSLKAHTQLKISGRFLTPEAAYRLAPFGVIDLISLVISDEHKHAYKEAERRPTEDAIL